MPHVTKICVIFKDNESKVKFSSVALSSLQYSCKIKVIIMDLV
jgi:hypothetical protein